MSLTRVSHAISYSYRPSRSACFILAFLSAAAVVLFGVATPLWAVDATIDVNSTITSMPEYGMSVHTSVYDNSLWYIDTSPDTPGETDGDKFDLLPGRLDDVGVNVLRYPGGGTEIRDSVGITEILVPAR